MTTEASTPHAMLTPAAICVGVAALLLRPFAGPGALAVMAGIGLLGVLTPAPLSSPASRGRVAAATAVGVGAFALARVLHGGAHAEVSLATLVPPAVAAVAEEAFFRRLVYGWLSRTGPALAVVGSAALFALVHVPGYGWDAIPVDAAAGLVFGWQRWASGGWAASCVTHVAANVLQVV